MSTLRQILGRNTDLALIALVIGVLGVLFAPIPPQLLDFLILLNISLALLVLLLTFYAPRPVEFSTFPAMLLIATLLRLSLNVSATRLILSEGDAGKVIKAVGEYAVAGNYVIGLIVFLILVVVQYVVVTSGAQRVSEVAARFTLDSMPGQQMSIDAELNMGLIDQEEAKRRRKNLEREAAFYGAMDGASKFVKGDAIAGILIMLINILGGLVIGVLQLGLPWGDALRHYTLLTIGDGIVTQIPALIISVGTGLIVTRSSSDNELGREVLRQLGGFPRSLLVVAALMVVVGCLPGMPRLPVAIVAGLLLFAWWARRQHPLDHADAPPTDAQPASESDPYTVYDLEAVEVSMGPTLAQRLGDEQGSLMKRIAAFRTQFAQETGFVIPKVRFRGTPEASDAGYAVAFYGDTVATGQLMVDRMLAIHPSGDVKRVPGVETREPTYGLPALWIEEAQRDAARSANFTLVDPTTVLFTHLTELIRQRVADLLTRAEAERMLGHLRQTQPGLVEELVPTLLGLTDVQKVLQNLLRERVPVRNLQAIVETLCDGARGAKDTSVLTELVRQRLATSICSTLSTDRKTLHVLTLDPAIEDALLGHQAEGTVRGDPRLVDGALLKVAAQAERMLKSNLVPVMLVSADVRRQVRALCERVAPHLRVISTAEVSQGYELRAFASISATSAPTGIAA
jgi:flagellar biosynthesis protein FlhA